MSNTLYDPEMEAKAAEAQMEMRIRRAHDLSIYWRRIDGAPKDGSRILVYLPEKWVQDGAKRYADGKPIMRLRGGSVMIAHWVSEPTDPVGKPLSLRAKGFIARGGYWSARGDGVRPLTHSPTHWMPIPAAPIPDDREDCGGRN